MREQIRFVAVLVCSIWLLPAPGLAEPERDALRDQPAQTDETVIDPKILADVVHPEHGLKTRGIRDEERKAYYSILEKTRHVDYKKQRAVAREFLKKRFAESKWRKFRDDPDFEFPIFVDLLQNAEKPDVYHGKLVTLNGHIRRLTPMSAGKNKYGLKTLYEAWIYTADSQHHPAVVVCTSIPQGMLNAFKKNQLLDHVSATGYFFKMYAYEADDEVRFAPLILAQRLQWRPPPPAAPPLVPQPILFAGIVVGVLSVLIVLWFIARIDRQFQKAYLKTEIEIDGAELDKISAGKENANFVTPNPDGISETTTDNLES